MTTVILPEGGALGLDWGQKKVGYATCDERGLVVTPRGVFRRKCEKRDYWYLLESDRIELRRLLGEWQPGIILMGCPNSTLRDGQLSSVVTSAQKLAQEISQLSKLPVELVDETLTSWASKSSEGGSDDARAAAVMMEDYIQQKTRGER